ncbi:MAG TPA: LptF/LptG family permease [Candidatus Acidoferrales bacterium]|nr:LptF/LptG family permease [Candidatus Acidoferrales bacterium]
MRIFTRYILKEVLSHALIGAAVFTFVIFMRDVGRLLELVVRNSAPVPSVAEIFFLIMPTALTVTIPMGVLVGILIGLSRMAADSEVTAMRASGVSVRTFLKIVTIFGFAAWIIALFNTAVLAPRSTAALADLQKSMASSQISFEVQPRVFYEDFKNYVLYVEDVSTASGGALWKNVFLADITTPGAPKITIAKEAVVSSGGANTIRLHLMNGEEHNSNINNPDQYTIQTFNEIDTSLTLPPAPRAAQEIVPVSQMSTSELLRQRFNPNREQARLDWVEFNRRLALPTACLVLVLIGIPLGLSARKGGKGAGFVLTIALVFIYYFLYGTGLSLARNGKIPAVLGVWLANIIFGLVGAALLWRTDKLPVEIGLGQALSIRFKNLVAALRPSPGAANGNGIKPNGVRKRRFSTRFPLLLDDYVLRTFLTNLLLILASFLVLTIVFTFFELISDIVHNKIHMLTVGEYLINQVPSLLYLVTPLSVLLGVLVTFGLMQKSNEITAMKATGISIYRAVVPILALSLGVAGGLFLLDQWYVPYANKRVETLKNLIKGRPAQTYSRPDRKWIFGQTSKKHGSEAQNRKIYYYEFYEPDRNVFGNISSFELDPHTFQISKRIFAARAHWSDDLQKWVFEKGWERSFDGDTVTQYQPFEVNTFAELNEPPNYFKKEVRQSQEMSYEELRNYIRDLQQAGFDVVRLKVALQKKIAFPLITLVMAVLAVPFALSMGRKGALSGIATALIIAVVYWVTSSLFEAMGNVNQLPPLIAAWAPDVIFGLTGGYLILKTPS